MGNNLKKISTEISKYGFHNRSNSQNTKCDFDKTQGNIQFRPEGYETHALNTSKVKIKITNK